MRLYTLYGVFGIFCSEMLNSLIVEDYGRVMKNEGLEQGRNEGLEQGRTEGLEQGRSEGEASGRAEREIEMAKAMKDKKYSFDEISELTGLPLGEIEKL